MQTEQNETAHQMNEQDAPRGRAQGPGAPRPSHSTRFIAGAETNTVEWFLGIPYAEPPTGDSRFKVRDPSCSASEVNQMPASRPQ